MKRTLLALALAAMPTLTAHADTPSHPEVPYTDITLRLNSITSFGVQTVRPIGVTLPAPRHLLKVTLENPPTTCPAGFTCAAVTAAPKVTIIFRDWELPKTGSDAHLFNICRRTIESAAPNAKILLRGDILYIRDTGNIVMRKLSSCYVGSDPKPQ